MNLKDFTDKKLAFALIKGDKILYKSKKQRLAPLIFCLKKYKSQMRGATVFDKVVGRAVALLLIYGRIKEVKTALISEGAIKLFGKNKIKLSYGKKVKHILNRTGDDLCPMEKLSRDKTFKEFCKILKVK